MIGLYGRPVADPGDHRRLRERQVLRMFAEVEPRRRLDAVRAVAEVNLVRVQLEDLVLGEVLFDLDREQRLVDLAAPALLRRQEDQFGELLCQRRRALDLLAGDEVLESGAQDRLRADPAVLVKVGVFRGDDRVDQRRRHVALGNDDPLLDRVLGEGNAVAVEDPRDDRRLVVLEGLHGGDPDGVREDEPGRNAEGQGDKIIRRRDLRREGLFGAVCFSITGLV